MKEEIINFEINNWFSGRDYPNDEIFSKWIKDRQFSDDDWCKENKLCVKTGPIDMSSNWCISAPRSWVEANCPDLLTDKEIKYVTIIHQSKKKKLFGGYEYEDVREEHTKKYSDFICHPEEDDAETVYGKISGWSFLEYCEENFGVTWDNSWWDDCYEDEEEEEENETPELD